MIYLIWNQVHFHEIYRGLMIDWLVSNTKDINLINMLPTRTILSIGSAQLLIHFKQSFCCSNHNGERIVKIYQSLANSDLFEGFLHHDSVNTILCFTHLINENSFCIVSKGGYLHKLIFCTKVYNTMEIYKWITLFDVGE